MRGVSRQFQASRSSLRATIRWFAPLLIYFQSWAISGRIHVEI
jgi:hypothetical protein